MDSPPPVVTTCFFYWSADHRDLHSFPTRRSSDLTSQELLPERMTPPARATRAAAAATVRGKPMPVWWRTLREKETASAAPASSWRTRRASGQIGRAHV